MMGKKRNKNKDNGPEYPLPDNIKKEFLKVAKECRCKCWHANKTKVYRKDVVIDMNWLSTSRYEFLSNDFIEFFCDRVYWFEISSRQKLSIEMVEKFHSRIRWKNLSNNHHVSEEVLRAFEDNLCWEWVSQKWPLSEKFISDFSDKLDHNTIVCTKKWREEKARKLEEPKYVDALKRVKKRTFDFYNLRKEDNHKRNGLIVDDNFITTSSRMKMNHSLGFHIWSSNLLDKNFDTFDLHQIDLLCQHQNLESWFIDKYQDRLSWISLSMGCHRIKCDDLIKYQDKLHMDIVEQYIFIPNYII